MAAASRSQPLTLVVVPHLRDLSQVVADLAHQVGEVPYALDTRRVVQVSKDFLTVAHGVDVVEVAIEETGDELVLLSTSGYGRDDLVEVQVVRERAVLLLADDLDGRAVEEQAGELTRASGHWRVRVSLVASVVWATVRLIDALAQLDLLRLPSPGHRRRFGITRELRFVPRGTRPIRDELRAPRCRCPHTLDPFLAERRNSG